MEQKILILGQPSCISITCEQLLFDNGSQNCKSIVPLDFQALCMLLCMVHITKSITRYRDMFA